MAFGGDGWGDGDFSSKPPVNPGNQLDGSQTQNGELYKHLWDGFGNLGHQHVPEEIELLHESPEFLMPMSVGREQSDR